MVLVQFHLPRQDKDCAQFEMLRNLLPKGQKRSLHLMSGNITNQINFCQPKVGKKWNQQIASKHFNRKRLLQLKHIVIELSSSLVLVQTLQPLASPYCSHKCRLGYAHALSVCLKNHKKHLWNIKSTKDGSPSLSSSPEWNNTLRAMTTFIIPLSALVGNQIWFLLLVCGTV